MRIGEFVAEYIREPAPASVERGPEPINTEILVSEDVKIPQEVGDPSEVSVPARV